MIIIKIRYMKETKIILLLHMIGLLISFGTGFPVLTILSILLAILLILKSDHKAIPGILLFLLPFSPIFKLNPSGRTFYNLVIAVSIIRLIILSGVIKFKYSQIFAILSFSIYVISLGGSSGLVQFINLIVYFTLIVLIFYQDSKISLRTLVIYFSLGIILASLISLLNNHIYGLSNFINQVSLKLNQGEYIRRFSGLNPNPNHYTMDISIALSAWFSLLVSQKVKKFDYLVIVILSVLGIFSLSKSFFVSYIAMLTLVLVSYGKSGLGNLLKGILFILTVLIGVYFIVGDQYAGVLFSRFNIDSNLGLASLTTGRSTIAETYFSYFYNHPFVLFFGRGFGASNLGHDPHNLYIELVYYLGIIGCILYVIAIKNILPKLKYKFRRNIFNYFPLILLLVRGLAINLLFSESMYIYFIILVVSFNTNFNSVQ